MVLCCLFWVKSNFFRVIQESNLFCNIVSNLKTRIFIQKITALFLLAVFILGITPKIILHNSIATHTDVGILCKDKSPVTHFHEVGIKCNCDNFVVDNPFNVIQFASVNFYRSLFVIQQEIPPSYYLSFHYYLASLRAPPLV